MKSLTLVLVLAYLAIAAANPNLLEETTFAKIKVDNRPGMVAFYHSSNPEHLVNLEVRTQALIHLLPKTCSITIRI